VQSPDKALQLQNLRLRIEGLLLPSEDGLPQRSAIVLLMNVPVLVKIISDISKFDAPLICYLHVYPCLGASTQVF
jgi:hypothetical protein